MRPRFSLAAFAVTGGLLAAAFTTTGRPASTALRTAAPVPSRPVPAAITAAAAAARAELGRQAVWDQAAADAEARRQEEAAEASRIAAAKHPAGPGTPTGSSPNLGDNPRSSGTGSAETAIQEFFGDVYDQAWGVTGCESGHNPGAVSPDGANWGLFQINTVHSDDFVTFAGGLLDEQGAPADDPRRTWRGGVLDARLNAGYARKLYDGHGGWKRDWSCAWAAYR